MTALLLVGPVAAPVGAAEVPYWRVAQLTGAALGCLRGAPVGAIALLACRGDGCVPIPWQLDERDARGDLVLDGGGDAARDDPAGVVDDNDELLWMAADGGRRMRPGELPTAGCGLEISLRGPGWRRWVYAIVVPAPAPRSPRSYVTYDAATDTVSGARIALGFGAPTPRAMMLRGSGGDLGPNVLDRLKIRASARFLGFLPLGRDEDDIEWIFGGWRAGPIRVVRREWQWVRLGWRLRTPIFRAESLVYRDWIELPVRLRLNFPPSYFFAGIEVQAVLDFRALPGWRLLAPGLSAAPLAAGDVPDVEVHDAEWLALAGPEATLVLHLQLGDTLRSLRTRLVVRENDGGYEPESVPGERPAVGFRLTDWGEVDRGHHAFAAVAYALAPGADVEAVLARQREPLDVVAAPIAPPPAE